MHNDVDETGSGAGCGRTSIPAVGVAVASVLEHKDAHQVDQQPSDGHGEQAIMVNMRRLQRSLLRHHSQEESS